MMIVRMWVMHVAVVVAVFGVVIVTVGIVVHAVHLPYFTHLRCRVQPGANESKAHRQVMLPTVLQQKAHWLIMLSAASQQKRTGRSACATSGKFDTSSSRIH